MQLVKTSVIQNESASKMKNDFCDCAENVKGSPDGYGEPTLYEGQVSSPIPINDLQIWK